MNRESLKRRDFVLKLAQAAGIAGMGAFAPSAFAKGRATSINSVSLKKTDGLQKFEFALDGSVQHTHMTLTSPDRYVIDFKNTQAKSQLKLPNTGGLVKRIRQARRNKSDLRVVFELTEKATAKTKLRKGKSGYLFEVALESRVKSKKVVSNSTVRRAKLKPMVIAIDAGHGGKDPGAIGRKGTKEKDVVLNIAKCLERQIKRQPGMKAVMTRKTDIYVSLRNRIAKARSQKADLFISIHADANPSRKLKGSSVYILSENGASSEAARWLANKENAYDSKFAGTQLQATNKVVSSMLLDLSLSDTIDRSLDLASGVLKELKSVNNLLRRKVESAGFVVLKSPDIPSMLIETAFISNPNEEKRLKTSKYQEKMAKAILKGVKQYQVAMQKKMLDSDDRYV